MGYKYHLFLGKESRSSVADVLRPRVVDTSVRELELKVNSEEKAGSQSVKVEIWKDRIFEALRAKGLS